MHHKLLKSRLQKQKDDATNVSKLPDATREGEVDMESTLATFNNQAELKSDQPNANLQHAPLNRTNFVGTEIGPRKSEHDQSSSSQDSAQATRNAQPKTRLEEAIRSFSASPDRVLFGHKDAAQLLGHTSMLGFFAGTLATPSSIFAQKVAEERDALAFMLQQRQHQTNLEKLRRIQTAMLIYQQGAISNGNNSATYLEAIATTRNNQRHIPVDPVNVLPNAPAPKPGIARVSGADPDLLFLAPKRSLGAIEDKPIKECPDQYQHLSKKVKRIPLPSEASELSKSEKDKLHKDDDELSSSSEGREAGHRFRPYQYEQWTEKFQELCDFRKERGHCQVPHTYKENPPLARWVKRQRYQYKLKTDSKTSTMTDERVVLLENIGFIWDSHAAAWAEKLHELKAYAKLKGDCNVPSTYPENPQLATWVKCQRRQYKLLRDKKTSNMTMERILELEMIGFVWEVRTKNWENCSNNSKRV